MRIRAVTHCSAQHQPTLSGHRAHREPSDTAVTCALSVSQETMAVPSCHLHMQWQPSDSHNFSAFIPIWNLCRQAGASWELAVHCSGAVLPTGTQPWEGWPWARHRAVSLNPDCPVPPQQTLILGWLFEAKERGHESSRQRADTQQWINASVQPAKSCSEPAPATQRAGPAAH